MVKKKQYSTDDILNAVNVAKIIGFEPEVCIPPEKLSGILREESLYVRGQYWDKVLPVLTSLVRQTVLEQNAPFMETNRHGCVRRLSSEIAGLINSSYALHNRDQDMAALLVKCEGLSANDVSLVTDAIANEIAQKIANKVRVLKLAHAKEAALTTPA